MKLIIILFLNGYFVLLGLSNSNIDSLSHPIESDSFKIRSGKETLELAKEFEESNTDSAYYFIQKALPHIDTSASSLLSSDYFLTLSKIKYKEGQANEALHFAKKAKQVTPEGTDVSIIGAIDIAISKGYLRIGEYDKSLEYALKGEKVALESLDSSLLASSLDVRGNIMVANQQYDKALVYFKRYTDILLSLGEDQTAARGFTNIGIVNVLKKDISSAFPFFKKAISISERFQDEYLKAFAYGSLGNTFVHANLLDSAVIYLQKSLTSYKATNNVFGILRASDQIGKLHRRRGDHEKALSVLLPAYKQSQELSTIKLSDDLAEQIGECYEQLKDYERATEYYKVHMVLKDSMLNEQITNAVNDANTKYETEKKEAEIERLALEDELNQVRITQQRLALGISIFGIGILSFLLYRLFGQNKKIESQNHFISKALSEKETLLKEIHHRVKNNLQIISSLLRIQTHQTQDDAALDALKEGQSRVEAMSLIHEDLYQHDDLKAIKFKEYLSKLSNSIFETYSISKSNIVLEKDIDDVELDIDTVVPLGLIVNELITNALKYAFPNQMEGVLRLSLKKSKSDIQLSIADNGVGINDDEELSGFGSGLVRSLLAKLEGEMSVQNDNGLNVNLIIPLTSS